MSFIKSIKNREGGIQHLKTCERIIKKIGISPTYKFIIYISKVFLGKKCSGIKIITTNACQTQF